MSIRQFYVVGIDDHFHVMWWSRPYADLASARVMAALATPVAPTTRYEVVGVIKRGRHYE